MHQQNDRPGTPGESPAPSALDPRDCDWSVNEFFSFWKRGEKNRTLAADLGPVFLSRLAPYPAAKERARTRDAGLPGAPPRISRSYAVSLVMRAFRASAFVWRRPSVVVLQRQRVDIESSTLCGGIRIEK